MNLRATLRKSHIARQLYFRSWLARYLAARFAGKRSFAQAGEDLIVEKLIGPVRWFVDIGAHDGISGSNTLYFALRGAHGICFEPIRDTYTKLHWLHALNPRIQTVRCGISDRSRGAKMIAADFVSYLPETEDPAHTAFSTIHESAIENVTLLRFEDAIQGLGIPDRCDLLTVDVEGHELCVLRSIDFSRHTFRVIVVETHLMDDEGRYKWRHPDLDKIERLMSQYSYFVVHRTWVNTIYLQEGKANLNGSNAPRMPAAAQVMP
jgi:FkbM family methyltransferase